MKSLFCLLNFLFLQACATLSPEKASELRRIDDYADFQKAKVLRGYKLKQCTQEKKCE